MGVLTTCTVRALKGNPVRTAVTVAGIALATALILAVVTSALSLYRYVVAAEVAFSGSYNASVLGATADEVAGLDGAPGVTRYAAVEREGYALVNEANELTPYVCVEGIVPGTDAQTLADLVALRLEEGSYPASSDEILLPASLVRSGVLDVAVGDELVLEVGHRVSSATDACLDAADGVAWGPDGRTAETLEGVETRTFTVCGLYADNDALFSGTMGAGASVAGLPAFTVAGALEGADGAGVYQVWCNVDDPLSAAQIVAPLFGDGATVYANAYINRLTSFSFDIGAYQTLAFFTGLVLAVVVASSVMLIRNSFAISVTERTRQFGLLASVGATRRQLRGMVLREALLLAAVAVPLGVALGYGGTALVLALCSPLIDSWVLGLIGTSPVGGSGGVPLGGVPLAFSGAFLAGAVVLALATTLLSAWGPARRAARQSAIDAIRSSADVKVPAGVRRSGHLAGVVFGIEGAIAAKSFRRASKPRRATVAALVTGTVLVSTALLLGTYVNAFFGAAMPAAADQPYDLRYWFSEGSISGSATVEEALETLAASDGVTASVYGVELYLIVTPGEFGCDADAMGDGLPEGYGDGFGAMVSFVQDDVYRAWLEELGLDVERYMDADRPLGVAVNAMTLTGGTRYATVRPFAGTPCSFGGTTEVDPSSGLGTVEGASVTVETYDASSGAELSHAEYTHRTVSVEVGAFADEGPWWIGTPSQPVVLLPLSALGSVDASLVEDPDAYANLFWEVLVRSDDPAATESSMLAHLQALGLSPSRLYNATSSSAGQVGLFRTAQAFLWAFAVIFSLIAVTGAFNNMYTSVGLRRREFAVLRSVGMTAGGLRKMLLCECLAYGVRVLVWSAAVSAAVSLLFWRALGASVAGAGYAVPWCVLPVSLAALVVVAVACAYALRKVDAGASPVEALRAETA